jgi:NADPH:quinone reductase-like Zn-dependent oxidoreductase
VTCGATSGHQVQLDLRAVFFKQLSILGATMGSMGEMNTAWAAVQAGAIVPVLDRVLPMSRLADAHALLEQRAIIGKVVVEQDL